MSGRADLWRYVTPCCGSTAWQWRSELGAYYCRSCREHRDALTDKKTDKRVQGVGQR